MRHIDLRGESEKIKEIPMGFKIKIVHTRTDHDCDGCGEIIPKGSYVPCYYIGSVWDGHWCWCCSIKCLEDSLEHPSY